MTEEQTPLIWTKYGNLPRSELANKPRWVISKEGRCVTFVDEWFNAAGESVSCAVHVYDTTGVDTESVPGNLE